MSETIFGRLSFEERLALYRDSMTKMEKKQILEAAAIIPGGSSDAPFAPIDPAMVEAAKQIVRDKGWAEERIGLTRLINGL